MSFIDVSPLDGLLQHLELLEYYPSKLTIDDVFKANTRKKCTSIGDIKWHILSKILSNDFTIRDARLRELLSNVSSDLNIFHPQDVLITLLLCSSPLFRKTLINKLFMCKLAIPFIWATDLQIRQEHASQDKGGKSSLFQMIKKTFRKDGNSSESTSYPQAQTLIYSRKGGLAIEQTLECYTWPLNFVSIDGQDSAGQPIDGFLSNQSFQVVSFIKVGKTDVSKSDVINHLITQPPHHNIFYTKNCALGDQQRSISDGTIEASCHIPSEDFDCFGNLTLILNLRGDAKYYQNQRQILKRISHVLVIFLNLTEIDLNKKQGPKRLREVCCDEETSGTSPTIFVFESPSDTEKAQKLYKILQDNVISKMCLKAIEINIRGKNGHNKGLHEISLDIKQNIVKHFKLCQTDLTTMCKDMAQMGTGCNEIIRNDYVNFSARVKAVFDLLDVNSTRLQTHWLEYSITLKKMYQEKFLQTKKELKDKTHQLLLQQYQSFAENPPKIICQMIRELLDIEKDSELLLFFLNHLDNCFDKRSRQELPRTLKKSQELIYQRHNTNQRSFLDTEIEQANTDNNFASFGIQNIIRDISHIFECVTEVKPVGNHLNNPKLMDKQLLLGIEKCPKIFAKLLAMGYLLELIDGDAFNIPTAWLQHLLKCLKDELGSKTRFLTLSILGLQSSGKSTLLNTMFGLQFPVSAGRCTKGVFVALVPVPSEQCPFDFLFVVDAEGLRTPEHEGTEYEHDNQLATFVVGVGDITIINVLGETTSEISNVLEIVVHAFLRLKQVQKNFQLYQSCILVHQNVQESSVSGKMATGRNRFIESLNEITKQAAEYEKVPNVSKFKDVIRFDSDKNVFYFPGLWCGSPPMSPVNPKYSEQVVKLKNFILDDIASHRETFFTVSDITERMQNLWDGILSEDFVFTYRNGIEIKASRKAEEIIFGIRRDIEFFLFEFLKADVNNAFAKCDDEEALIKAKNTITEKLKAALLQRINSLLDTWNAFVRNDQLSDILKQWKQSKIEHLQKFGEEKCKSAEEEITQMMELIRVDMTQNILLQQEDMSSWKILADKFVETFLETGTLGSINERIEENFKREWTVHAERFSMHEQDASSIQNEIKTALYDYFRVDSVYLTKELEREFEPNVDREISENKCYSKSKYSAEQLNEIEEIKSKISKNIDLWLEDKTCARFSITEVKRILDGINEEFNLKKNRFNLDTTIKAMLMVQVAKTLIVKCQDMHRKYEEQYGIKAKIAQYKRAALNQFKEMVNTSLNRTDSIQGKIPLQKRLTEDENTAKAFASVIMKQVKRTVSTFLPQDVVNDVMAHFSCTKYNLITDILMNLAQKEAFEDYYSYIHNTKAFVQQYLLNFINNRMFSVENKYAALANARISKMVNKINESVEFDAEICQNSLSAWTEIFLENIDAVGTFCLMGKDFGDSRTRYIYSLKQFCEYLKKNVAEEKDLFIKTFAQETAKGVIWEKNGPHAEVYKCLWGCPETCPFCFEPCASTEVNHTDKNEHIFDVHSCVQHRPDGITGWRYIKTQILSISVCNVNVISDRMFDCNNDRFRSFLAPDTNKSIRILHPYSKYKKYAPDWEIKPDCKLSSSRYWAWFLCTFKENIKKKYNVIWPDIPKEWENVSKNEAIASLTST